MAFYTWQWWKFRTPAEVQTAPEDGTPEYYRQGYSDVLEQIESGELEQARGRLDGLQVARGEAAGRLPSETIVAPSSDLHSNPAHVGGTSGVNVEINSPIPRDVNAALGRCQLRIEWMAKEENGRWEVDATVIEPEYYEPLSEQENEQIRRQARASASQGARPGETRWSQFIFNRVDCLRN